MRTRTLITSAAFLAASAAAGTAFGQAQLKGSDTLFEVTKDVITACGLNTALEYIGQGSGGGQSAMAGGLQHVAPMSRQLNGTGCTTNSRQLMIGLDGLSIVTKNVTGGAPSTCTDDIGGQAAPIVLNGVPQRFVLCTADAQCVTAGGTTCNIAGQYCDVGGSILGCDATQGCSAPGQYTFDNNTPTNPADDWKDVLAQIYGGQNHTGNTQLITDATEVNADGTAVCFGITLVNDPNTCNATTACPAGQFCNNGQCAHQTSSGTARTCKRNPARIDCSNPVRGVLLSNYGSVISTPVCTTNPALGNCTKVKHAFRRDDLSGTTDAFQALVGLIALPPQTQMRSSAGAAFAPEIADFASTVSPFCNGGTAVGNKGFADGTDLDPYRRACTTGPAPNRFGLENVCQAWAAPTNADTACYVAGGSPAVLSPVNYPQKDRSAPQGRGFVAAGSVDNLAALQNDYFLTTATRPRCLGVVVPISMPLDVPGQNSWDNYRYPLGGTCTSGARGVSNPWAGHTMVCPDGASKSISGSCRLAINTGVSPNRFDCAVDSPLPSGTVSDSRIYNLMPVNKLGHVADASPAGEGPLQDAYNNPFFPAAPNLRRFARRYYGIHMIRPDNSTGLATTAGPCVDNDDTSQIGCLVKASPCSVGYAGREAADAGPTFANVGLRLTGIQATVTNIQNLATGGTPVYPMARKLWFNSFQPTPAPEVIGFETPNLTPDEQTLATCMGLPGKCTVDADCTGANSPPCNTATGRCFSGSNGIADTAITAHNFVTVPASVPRLVLNGTGQGCPLP